MCVTIIFFMTCLQAPEAKEASDDRYIQDHGRLHVDSGHLPMCLYIFELYHTRLACGRPWAQSPACPALVKSVVGGVPSQCHCQRRLATPICRAMGSPVDSAFAGCPSRLCMVPGLVRRTTSVCSAAGLQAVGGDSAGSPPLLDRVASIADIRVGPALVIETAAHPTEFFMGTWCSGITPA